MCVCPVRAHGRGVLPPKKKKVKVLVSQLYLTLCNPTDCSPAGSTVHGVLQARIQEWVDILSPGGLHHPGIEVVSPTLQADSLMPEPPGKPINPTELSAKNPSPKAVTFAHFL